MARISCLANPDVASALRVGTDCPIDSLVRLSETANGRARIGGIMGVYGDENEHVYNYIRDNFRDNPGIRHRVWNLIIAHWNGEGALLDANGIVVNGERVNNNTLRDGVEGRIARGAWMRRGRDAIDRCAVC